MYLKLIFRKSGQRNIWKSVFKLSSLVHFFRFFQILEILIMFLNNMKNIIKQFTVLLKKRTYLN